MKKKILTFIVVGFIVFSINISASASQGLDIVQDDTDSLVEITSEMTPFGYDDDAIYYTRSSPFWKVQRSEYFEPSIYRTETRSGLLFTGTLKFTGRVINDGNGRYRGAYEGTLYYYGDVR